MRWALKGLGHIQPSIFGKRWTLFETLLALGRSEQLDIELEALNPSEKSFE